MFSEEQAEAMYALFLHRNEDKLFFITISAHPARMYWSDF
jgi:hypothetical protein